MPNVSEKQFFINVFKALNPKEFAQNSKAEQYVDRYTDGRDANKEFSADDKKKVYRTIAHIKGLNEMDSENTTGQQTIRNKTGQNGENLGNLTQKQKKELIATIKNTSMDEMMAPISLEPLYFDDYIGYILGPGLRDASSILVDKGYQNKPTLAGNIWGRAYGSFMAIVREISPSQIGPFQTSILQQEPINFTKGNNGITFDRANSRETSLSLGWHLLDHFDLVQTEDAVDKLPDGTLGQKIWKGITTPVRDLKWLKIYGGLNYFNKNYYDAKGGQKIGSDTIWTYQASMIWPKLLPFGFDYMYRQIENDRTYPNWYAPSFAGYDQKMDLYFNLKAIHMPTFFAGVSYMDKIGTETKIKYSGGQIDLKSESHLASVNVNGELTKPEWKGLVLKANGDISIHGLDLLEEKPGSGMLVQGIPTLKSVEGKGWTPYSTFTWGFGTELGFDKLIPKLPLYLRYSYKSFEKQKYQDSTLNTIGAMIDGWGDVSFNIYNNMVPLTLEDAKSMGKGDIKTYKLDVNINMPDIIKIAQLMVDGKNYSAAVFGVTTGIGAQWNQGEEPQWYAKLAFVIKPQWDDRYYELSRAASQVVPPEKFEAWEKTGKSPNNMKNLLDTVNNDYNRYDKSAVYYESDKNKMLSTYEDKIKQLDNDLAKRLKEMDGIAKLPNSTMKTQYQIDAQREYMSVKTQYSNTMKAKDNIVSYGKDTSDGYDNLKNQFLTGAMKKEDAQKAYLDYTDYKKQELELKYGLPIIIQDKKSKVENRIKELNNEKLEIDAEQRKAAGDTKKLQALAEKWMKCEEEISKNTAMKRILGEFETKVKTYSEKLTGSFGPATKDSEKAEKIKQFIIEIKNILSGPSGQLSTDLNKYAKKMGWER